MHEMVIERFISNALVAIQSELKCCDAIALTNQRKVLKAFQENKIALRHFNGTTGYGYDDVGRDALRRVYANVFDAQSAIVSPNIVSGTHALSLCLFSLLKNGDSALSVSGEVYDTLLEAIFGNNNSLSACNITFEKLELINNDFNYEEISRKLLIKHYRLIYVQRSRGYSLRDSLSIDKISYLITMVKSVSPDTLVMVDNCYGEFTDIKEPTSVGADIIAGSLIKNPGGGIAPTGGYICGTQKCIDEVACRLTAPSIGLEVGSYQFGYQYFYQGLFLAPHTVAQALKTSYYFHTLFQN